jgi:hypothetical protein
MTMKISHATIVWTPNRPGFPIGFRGKARIFATHGADHGDEHIAAFARSAGRSDERSHGPLEVRQDLCREIALEMKRDGVNQRLIASPYGGAVGAGNLGEEFGPDTDAVHHLMLGVDEYASDNA